MERGMEGMEDVEDAGRKGNIKSATFLWVGSLIGSNSITTLVNELQHPICNSLP